MRHIKFFFAALLMSFALTGVALADHRYNISAVDDVNGDATFTGSMVLTEPFSLNYGFAVVNFELHDLIDNVSYLSSSAAIEVGNQGFKFTSNDLSSSFILTLYPDSSYFSEYAIAGQSAVNNSGYFGFTEQIASVPEPETYAMFMAGLGLMGVMTRRTKK